jgi:hypothetical protein
MIRARLPATDDANRTPTPCAPDVVSASRYFASDQIGEVRICFVSELCQMTRRGASNIVVYGDAHRGTSFSV